MNVNIEIVPFLSFKANEPNNVLLNYAEDGHFQIGYNCMSVFHSDMRLLSSLTTLKRELKYIKSGLYFSYVDSLTFTGFSP